MIASEAAPLWILATLLTLFAAGSLIIAAIGQYAVVAFDGRRRTREFGLRIALGASKASCSGVTGFCVPSRSAPGVSPTAGL